MKSKVKILFSILIGLYILICLFPSQEAHTPESSSTVSSVVTTKSSPVVSYQEGEASFYRLNLEVNGKMIHIDHVVAYSLTTGELTLADSKCVVSQYMTIIFPMNQYVLINHTVCDSPALPDILVAYDIWGNLVEF